MNPKCPGCGKELAYCDFILDDNIGTFDVVTENYWNCDVCKVDIFNDELEGNYEQTSDMEGDLP